MEDNDVTLTIMNLERFATHDGPGIRTAIFLKGCPLHCPWCANPETQSLGQVIFHDRERCVGCRSCLAACMRGAIGFAEGHPTFDVTRCDACRACERACLQEAIEVQGSARTVGEVLDVAERDRDYYEESGGGITVSGGEPLMFVEKALPLLRAAKERHLDTAVETTGNVPSSTIRAVEPYVDHFLYDFKHEDGGLLRRVTGGNAELIETNLSWLVSRCADKINVRVPVIPGFNFSEETLTSMIDHLHALGVPRVNLLPYHTLGLGKYQKLGREYQCPRRSLHDEDLEPYHRHALGLGMESKIGA